MPKKPSSAKKKLPANTLRRIKTVIACVVLGLVLAVPIPFVNNVIGYGPLFAYVLLLLISFVYLNLLARKLTFESEGIGDGCLRCERVPFKLVVRNDSILPAVCVKAKFFISDLFGEEGSSTIRVITLPPRSTKAFDFGVRFDHIGTYTVGIQQVEITDSFGIFRKVKSNPQMHQVLVQPLVHDVAGLQVTTDAATESKKSFTAVINDGMDYSGVREYRWGDPLKAIHWKLSAGAITQDYYTRLYETVTNPGLEIIVDFDNPREVDALELMFDYDALVESAFSIDKWCAEQGLEAALLFADNSGQTTRYVSPLEMLQADILERMPRIGKGNGNVALDILGQEAASIYSQNNLVFCTSCITSELCDAIASAKVKRRNPILIAVIPDILDDEEREEIAKPLKRLGALGIPYTVIGEASELGGYES